MTTRGPGLEAGGWGDPTRDEMTPLESSADAIVSLGGAPRGEGRDAVEDADSLTTGAEEEGAVPNPQPRAPSPHVSRRHALKVLGAAPAVLWMQQQQQQQQQQPGQQKTPQTHEAPNPPAESTRQPPPSPKKAQFFTPREMRTVRVLANDIIPRDERSGSATDAGVPEFIDYNLSAAESDQETRVAWRGGLRWLDTECRKRFGVAYAAAAAAQRHALLDDISFPRGGATAAEPFGALAPALRPGAAFFARARDMVAAGFFSSAVGFKDLQYIGNVANPNWQGCPEAALRKLGVSYDLMNTVVKPEE